MGPALPSRRRFPLRRNGKKAGDRISGWGSNNSSRRDGACPVSGSEAPPKTRQAASLLGTSVTFGLTRRDFCTLHVWAQIRQDSGYPEISLLPGLTAHVQFR